MLKLRHGAAELKLLAIVILLIFRTIQVNRLVLRPVFQQCVVEMVPGFSKKAVIGYCY